MNTTPIAAVSVDFLSKTITVSRTFLNASRKVGSSEFMTLKQLTEEMPTFSIVTKPIPYRRKMFQPTYEWMCNYIQTQPDAQEAMNEFMQFRCLYRNYNQVRSWFMRKYPDAANPEAFCGSHEKYLSAA